MNQVKRKHRRFGLQTVKANTYDEGTYELRSEIIHFCKKKILSSLNLTFYSHITLFHIKVTRKFTLSSSLHSSSFQLDSRSSQITTEAAAVQQTTFPSPEKKSHLAGKSSTLLSGGSYVRLCVQKKNQSNKISVIKIKEPKNTNKSTSNGR